MAKGFTVSSLSLMIHFLELALAKGKVNKKQYDDYVRQFKTAIAAYEKFMKLFMMQINLSAGAFTAPSLPDMGRGWQSQRKARLSF